jgi:hypothetical protein
MYSMQIYTDLFLCVLHNPVVFSFRNELRNVPAIAVKNGDNVYNPRCSRIQKNVARVENSLDPLPTTSEAPEL